MADDHRIVAEGIAKLLEEDAWLVDWVTDGAELLQRCAGGEYTIAIIDLSMPGFDGIAVLRAFRTLDLPTPVLVISMHAEPEFVRKAMAEGARGYVCKALAAEDLYSAIAAIAEGHQYISPSIRVSKLHGSELTERQLEIARLINLGMRTKEIAYKLGLSTRTIESHKYGAMQKRDVNSVMDLLRSLRAEGLIP